MTDSPSGGYDYRRLSEELSEMKAILSRMDERSQAFLANQVRTERRVDSMDESYNKDVAHIYDRFSQERNDMERRLGDAITASETRAAKDMKRVMDVLDERGPIIEELHDKLKEAKGGWSSLSTLAAVGCGVVGMLGGLFSAIKSLTH